MRGVIYKIIKICVQKVDRQLAYVNFDFWGFKKNTVRSVISDSCKLPNLKVFCCTIFFNN